MKKVWIFNHYASTPSTGNWLRHYNFSRHMMRHGYEVTIFASSAQHNTGNNLVGTDKRFTETDGEGVPYVYVRTRDYEGNGLSRILNMLDYYRGVIKAAGKMDRPDVIYASSPHPLSCVAAIKLARRYKIPCICEVRDLWPESLVIYMNLSKHNPVVVALRILEKWIYKKCDGLIFTMPSGVDYILERGWDKKINLSKVHSLNNGIDLTVFDDNKEKYPAKDEDLLNPNYFNFVYTGSVRRVNRLDLIANAARILHNRGNKRIRFLIWGTGDKMDELMRQTQDLPNFILKGQVPKAQIPAIVSLADANLVHWEQTNIMRYGNSANKLFDYLAAGKPVLSTLCCGQDIIKQTGCGVICPNQSPETIADSAASLSQHDAKTLQDYGSIARKAAADYDFSVLTQRLMNIIKSL